MNENTDLTKNAELNEALREFENKQGTVEKPKASKEASVFGSQKTETGKDLETPKMVQWVMKVFSIKQKGAEYVLLGVAILFFITTIFFLLNAFSGPIEPPDGFKENSPKSILKYDNF